MNKIYLAILLLVSCSGEVADYSWFEGNWISDTDASFAINPDYAELSGSDRQIVREMYGRIKWSISDGTMGFQDDRYNQLIEFSTQFDVVPISAERFLMRMEVESRIIWRSDSGFCTQLDPDYLKAVVIEGGNLGLECFKKYGLQRSN